MAQGTLKWFNADKGLGFAIQARGYRGLPDNQWVEFHSRPKFPGPVARRRLPGAAAGSPD